MCKQTKIQNVQKIRLNILLIHSTKPAAIIIRLFFVCSRMFTVSLEGEGSHQNLFLYWPSLLIHVVDENSPFWSLSRDQLLLGQYELLVVLSGVSATTSKLFQVVFVFVFPSLCL